ncbi:histidinol-phosphatase [Scatolibacter rhodanostii]|uniref:histidinol-phosphatase n=1 Tax=Scatolibacter rhodanostii TaxID=2014781 RepID=UPI000C0818D2|nr:histidinol-phosphatase [Scatolibacter rhodanostii]
MKKFDLHVHTVPTISDSQFDFHFETLKEYVTLLHIDCIAITNHNIFDLSQFRYISENLDILVLPGIEINLEGGHLLLIANSDELIDFNLKCNEISKLIQSADDCITVSQLKQIFVNMSNYLLIPHYEKKPILKATTIQALRQYINAGEVNSVKKFQYCLKDNTCLTPVYFSDIRIKDGLLNFPTRQTYMDVDEITLPAIKICLQDKLKVSLSKEDGNKLFQVLPNGLQISTGLTVILGNRSSGKTHTLNEISREIENVKYVKQFQLLETDQDKDKRNFEALLSKKQSSVSEDFLKEFKDVVDDVKEIDLSKYKKDIDSYLVSLLKNASEVEKADIFSKTCLFNESLFLLADLENLKKLVDSVINLIENTMYRDIINKYVSVEELKQLAVELMKKYISEKERNLKKTWMNNIITNIKDSLKMRTAATIIPDIDLYKIMFDKAKILSFFKVTRLIQSDRKIHEKNMFSFKIEAHAKKFGGAGELKSYSGKKIAFSDAFLKYENPYYYLQELKLIDLIAPTEYYKYFVKIDYAIMNEHNFPVSGGERSEFNLLNAINDAMQYDMLLLDEPESSFDNLFLQNSVNEMIKHISKTIPVVIITHNNTVGASIKPDYIVYTKKNVTSGNVVYQIFSGYPTNKQLKSLDGETISNYQIILNCLEAGTSAYKERENSYEILKN